VSGRRREESPMMGVNSQTGLPPGRQGSLSKRSSCAQDCPSLPCPALPCPALPCLAALLVFWKICPQPIFTLPFGLVSRFPYPTSGGARAASPGLLCFLQGYKGLFAPLLTPSVWERKGNIPAVTRLLQVRDAGGG